MKKALLILAILAATVTSCRNSGGQDSVRGFADEFINAENKAWRTGNLADLKVLEDAEVIYHLPGGVDLAGWKAHEDFILKARPTVSDLHQEWQYLSGEGTHFALSYASTAVLRGDQDSPPVRASNSYLFVFRLRDRKIVEVWVNGSATNTPVNGNER